MIKNQFSLSAVTLSLSTKLRATINCGHRNQIWMRWARQAVPV
jgi:hypothetical protein